MTGKNSATGRMTSWSGHQSAIGTLVGRVSRYTILVHFDGKWTADQLRDCLVEIFDGLPVELKKTLTWDQGVEMARHRSFTTRSKVPVFFCEAASPWQRGSNENTNGLLRHYFPKHSDLSVYSDADLVEAAAELNDRPRKVLAWRTPSEHVSMMLEDLGVATFP